MTHYTVPEVATKPQTLVPAFSSTLWVSCSSGVGTKQKLGTEGWIWSQICDLRNRAWNFMDRCQKVDKSCPQCCMKFFSCFLRNVSELVEKLQLNLGCRNMEIQSTPELGNGEKWLRTMTPMCLAAPVRRWGRNI